jgi:hypothetical protein
MLRLLTLVITVAAAAAAASATAMNGSAVLLAAIEANAKRHLISNVLTNIELTTPLDITYTSAQRSVPDVCNSKNATSSPTWLNAAAQTRSLNPLCDSVNDCSFAPITTVAQPIISWGQPDFMQLHTLALVDIGNVPGTDAAFTHMLVTNIPGDAISSGDHVLRYFQPANPSTLPHNYVWMLWQHAKPVVLSADDAKSFANGFLGARSSFQPQAFATKYLLGPVRGLNWMYEKVDGFVAMIWHFLPATADTWMPAADKKAIAGQLKTACAALI